MATIILNKIENIPLEDPSKTILLNSLIRMVSYKDFLIEDNQNKVLSLLTSNVRNNILINFGDDNIELIIDSQVSHLPQYNIHGTKVVILEEMLNYVCSFLTLLYHCCLEKNISAENISQVILPLSQLNKMFLKPKTSLFFKYSLAKIFVHVHLETDKLISPSTIDQLTPCYKMLSEDLLKYSEMDISRENRKRYNSRIYHYTSLGLKSHGEMVLDYLGALCEVFFLSFKKILKPG